MKWSDIGRIVAKSAPLVGGLLGGPAGAAAGQLVASALGTEPTPAAVNAALADPESAIKLRALELDHKTELTRLNLEAETARLGEINQTMRSEVASNDPYVRRWRPTYGYAAAITWALQMVGLTAIVGIVAVGSPAQAPAVISALAALLGPLMVLWGVALSILGVSISKRSQDKQVAAGQVPEVGLLGAIAERLRGKNDD